MGASASEERRRRSPRAEFLPITVFPGTKCLGRRVSMLAGKHAEDAMRGWSDDLLVVTCRAPLDLAGRQFWIEHFPGAFCAAYWQSFGIEETYLPQHAGLVQ